MNKKFKKKLSTCKLKKYHCKDEYTRTFNLLHVFLQGYPQGIGFQRRHYRIYTACLFICSKYKGLEQSSDPYIC